jgi:hypothetical protein
MSLGLLVGVWILLGFFCFESARRYWPAPDWFGGAGWLAGCQGKGGVDIWSV